MKLCQINGLTGTIPPDHRALAYGDGVFETIRINKGQAEFLDLHLERMFQGAQSLRLNVSREEIHSLKQHVIDSVKPAVTVHVLKIMLLRRYEGRGYGFDSNLQTTDVVIQISPYQPPSWSMSGARVEISPTFISENKTLKGIKHLNRLDSVLARASISSDKADEVLLKAQSGSVIEGSMSNVFFKVNHTWLTPEISTAGVEGIFRNLLIKRFDNIVEGEIFESDLDRVESAFLTNSLIGIVPIKSLSNRPLTIPDSINIFQKEIEVSC